MVNIYRGQRCLFDSCLNTTSESFYDSPPPES